MYRNSLLLRHFTASLLLAIGLAVPSLEAQTPGDQIILIRNVVLFDRSAESEDVVANILIEKGILKLVTKDHIGASEADQVFDAENGFLMGKLDIKAPATFMILDQDPRVNFDALLDTANHVRFAIREGEVVRNLLLTIEEAETVEESRGWLAYTPPPFVLPLSYESTRKWNGFRTKAISGVFGGGLVIDRMNWLSQDAASMEQVELMGEPTGDLGEFSLGEIRALRFGLVGTLNFKRPWVYVFFAATNSLITGFDRDESDDYAVFDLRLDIPLGKHSTVSIGKQKEPISMERLMAGVALPFTERTIVADSMLPSRNVGIVFSGITPNQRAYWAVGGFDDAIESGDDFGDGSQQLVGRITGVPFTNADDSNLFHLGAAARYTDAAEGLRYKTEPVFNLAPDFVDTGLFQAESSITYDFELSWRKGPFWLHSEFVRNEIDAPFLGDPVMDGYHVAASWVFTRELRPYKHRSGLFGTVPVARSVYDGGWGAWEGALQWSDLDLTDGEVEGGDMQILSAGLNWFLTSFFSFGAHYRGIELDRFGLQGSSEGFMARIVLLLE